jgi:hypothetical protein
VQISSNIENVFRNMAVNVPLKVKNTAATVDCLFKYEICFHLSKEVKQYTLHVREATIHDLTDILCSENVGSAWGYLEELWCKL